MTDRIRTLVLVLVTSLAGAPGGVAQTAGTLPRSSELPASTRAMALGDAYMMDARQSDALFYHPALLTDARGFTLDLQRWDTEASQMSASVARAFLGGGLGVGLQVLQYGAAAEGPAAAPAGQDALFSDGPVAVSERAATLGYARSLLGIDVGAAMRLVEERVGSFRDETLLFDVGASTELGPFTAALSYQGLGEQLSVGGTAFERPDRLRLGVGAYGQPLGPLDVGVAAAVEYVGDEIVPGGGLEVGYWPIRGRTFVARIGARRVVDGEASPLSFGFAFWADSMRFEWAFQPVDVAGSAGTHRFSVGWR